MKSNNTYLLYGIAMLLIFLSSCANYTMTREQLYTQIKAATPQQVTTTHQAALGSQQYMSNGVKQITCTDKHGNSINIANTPKVEMRITDVSNKKHIFYFDTIVLEDSTLTGMNSRILGTRKSVQYADIKKVELQKGAKAYYYANK